MERAKLRRKLQKQSEGRVRGFMEKGVSLWLLLTWRDLLVIIVLADKNGFELVNTRPQKDV